MGDGPDGRWGAMVGVRSAGSSTDRRDRALTAPPPAPGMVAMALVELRSLSAGHPGRPPALVGVDWTFRGGAAGLLGPNGAGKSTLLKTLLGFLPPLAGSASVAGFDLPGHALAVRAKVGYMPEQEAYLPGMTAVAFTAYMAELGGLPPGAAMERAHEVLQYVGLGEARYRALDGYSLGMKQRAKLAQAIVHDPDLLLLDEPTNGLDPAGRRDMLALVADLAHRKGMAVILCSHLLKDVESVADEILVLGGGRAAWRKTTRTADGAAADDVAPTLFDVRVKGDPAAFAAALPARGGALAGPSAPGDGSPDMRVAGDAAAIHRAAADAGVLVRRMAPVVERMEDIYLDATRELARREPA